MCGICGDLGAAEELRAAGFELASHQLMAADDVSAPPSSLEDRTAAGATWTVGSLSATGG